MAAGASALALGACTNVLGKFTAQGEVEFTPGEVAGTLERLGWIEVRVAVDELGASDPRVFFTITMPLAVRGIVAGTVLAFARALGEFGATILVAGNIPGRTSTLSLAIYSHVQLGKDSAAFRLLLVSVALAFAAVWISEWCLKRGKRV